MQNNVLSYKSLGDRVYERLLLQILSGRRAVRQKLSEARLAKEFGVSRVPVREALNRLTVERLIESVPRHGKFVKTFTAGEIRDAYELRLILEPVALRRVFERIDRSGSAKIRQNYIRLEKIGGIKDAKKRYDLLLRVDEELHHVIRHYSGNKLLEGILQQLDRMARPLRAFDAVDSARMIDLAKERKEIMDAIIRRDLSRAEALLITHIRKGEESVLKKMFKTNQKLTSQMAKEAAPSMRGRTGQGKGAAISRDNHCQNANRARDVTLG